MASPASHDVRVVKRSALAGVAGVGRRHTRQPRRHVSPRRRRARRPVLPRSNLYLIEVYGRLSDEAHETASKPQGIQYCNNRVNRPALRGPRTGAAQTSPRQAVHAASRTQAEEYMYGNSTCNTRE